MTPYIFIVLLLIGLFAGALSGFVGIGGGVVIVPALVYILGLTQHDAQGTSLLLMLPPIGVLAVMNYARAGEINWTYGAIIAIFFVLGAYFGSKLSLRLNASTVKLIFGVLMFYVAIKMIYSGYKGTFNESQSTNTTKVD